MIKTDLAFLTNCDSLLEMQKINDKFEELTDQNWPSVHSQSSNLIFNQDGSVDAFFGPNVRTNSGINCVKTIPGKNWYSILRLYGVTALSNFNNWKPDEIIELYTT